MTPQELAEACAAALYAGDTASQSLGVRIGGVGPGRATATMTVTSAMLNGHAIGHGGYVFLLADTAFAFACNTYDRVTVAAGADVSFLEPARAGDELTATAVERARRGRSGLYDVTVHRADGTVLAEFRGRSRSSGTPILGPSGH
ncbi:hydroxyphenylacetyl-CoA thioesterase PaaI [Dactylosporangium sp. NPDC049140]|uniref:hydroxyphenylacetyl-CoA thioesterase PaaI n=1 Tax=Dactylosporangium sp. NPDC049140 TaxID=3155647 RepID=UPI0033DE4645